MRLKGVLLAAMIAAPASAGAQQAPDLSLDTAILGGLDKVTARVVSIEAPVGQPVRFGTLEIIVRACRKHRPEESPESAAFLDVWELKPGFPAQSLFRGWMFASSPALSSMEHPVFDIWVLDCRSSTAPSGPAGPRPSREAIPPGLLQPDLPPPAD